MPQMSYFRRSALAGKSLKRPTAAQVRGNLRRNDIDQFSAVPYFDGITQGDTLIVEGMTAGVPTEATVGITANVQHHADISVVIADLNAGLAAVNIKAFDDGGCIGLRSTLAGSLGRVKVKGGTAAKALGFDLTLQEFFSVGGDITAAPEGRGFGQPFGASAPVPGENLTSDVFSRSLGRIMANTDVLFAELMKQEVVLKQVATVTATAAALSYYDLGSEKVFIGAAPTKEDLAHLFFAVDQATGQISQSRVTSLINQGSPTVLFGQDQVVVANATITSVHSNDVVECAAGNFQGAGVVAGDYVQISGATNLDPFSNNGYRWVVEKVLDQAHLVLRPMSPAELQAVGTTVDEGQPTIDLNSANTGAWGTLTVSRGLFAKNVRMVFTPPIPKGMTVNIWAPVPASQRDRKLFDLSRQGYGVFASLTHDFDPVPNALLTRPFVNRASGSSVLVFPFMVRFHGRPVRVPGQTFVPGPGAGPVTWYIYWDENDCQVKITNTPALFSVTESRTGTATAQELNGLTPTSPNKGHHIASVLVNADGTIPTSGITMATRISSDSTTQMTVGHGGQFSTLAEALEYHRRLLVSGATRSQIELVVVSDQTAPIGGWLLPAMAVLIRGGSPRVRLSHGTTGPLFAAAAGATLMLEGVSVDMSKTLVTGTLTWWVSNLNSALDGNHKTYDTNGLVDIGASSTAVNIGRTGTTTTVRGPLSAQEDVNIPVARRLRIGAPGENTAGVDVDVVAGAGRVLFGKTNEPTVALDKDAVGLLVGGATDADTLHTHGSKANDNAVVKLTGDQNISGVKSLAVHPRIQTYYVPSLREQYAPKGYVDDTVTTYDATNVKLAGAQTVTGSKTFQANQILDVAEAAITDVNYDKHLTRRSYVRRHAGERLTTDSRMPIATAADWLGPSIWTGYVNWPTGAAPQIEMGTRTGQNAQSRVLLVGTQTGNPTNIRSLAMQPLQELQLPFKVPFGKNGGLCRYVLSVTIHGNDAITAARVFVNGQFMQPATPNRAAWCTGLTELNIDSTAKSVQCGREYFNVNGGYNGSGSLTQTQLENGCTMIGVWGEGGGGGNRTYVVEWDADPDKPQSFAVDIWGVALVQHDGAGNSRGRVTLALRDPETAPASTYLFNSPLGI